MTINLAWNTSDNTVLTGNRNSLERTEKRLAFGFTANTVGASAKKKSSCNKGEKIVRLKWSFSWSLRRKVHWWNCHVLCFKNIVLFWLWCQLHLTETLAYARSVWGIRLVVQNMSVGWAAHAICVCGGVNTVLFCRSHNRFNISKIRIVVHHFCHLTSPNIYIFIKAVKHQIALCSVHDSIVIIFNVISLIIIGICM